MTNANIRSLFADIETWVFDLDNTLYPPEMALFDQINVKMTAYVMTALNLTQRAADTLRHQYYHEHGTTLAGLMDNHGLDPAPYLEDVHDIDFTVLRPDATLAAQIKALPGRKIVFTNGTAPYAERVVAHRGLSGCFDAVYGVEHAGLRPKPETIAFETVFATDGFERNRAVMFEDDARNLRAPFEMGLRTVHIASAEEPQAFIMHHSHDLSAFLSRII